jgi:hypothetical protein
MARMGGLPSRARPRACPQPADPPGDRARLTPRSDTPDLLKCRSRHTTSVATPTSPAPQTQPRACPQAAAPPGASPGARSRSAPPPWLPHSRARPCPQPAVPVGCLDSVWGLRHQWCRCAYIEKALPTGPDGCADRTVPATCRPALLRSSQPNPKTRARACPQPADPPGGRARLTPRSDTPTWRLAPMGAPARRGHGRARNLPTDLGSCPAHGPDLTPPTC